MKKFKLPRWQQRAVKARESRQQRLQSKASREMNLVMERAVDYILEHYDKTGRYVDPTLSDMSSVMEDFYRGIVSESIKSSEEMKSHTKKLAKLPTGLPNKINSAKDIFNNSRYWSRIMKRSGSLTASLQKQYLRKLKDRFKNLMPLIQNGLITPKEAKDKMMETWKTTKSRAETIFRTESTKYFAEGQIKFFEKDPEIIGFMFDALIDQSITKICKSRHGLVYRPETELLKKNTPPCFAGESLILTSSGWKRIDTITVDEYVWTHEERFRRVEKLHCTFKKQERLFQIGYAMATANHPYLTRSGNFIEAESLRKGEGVCSIPSNMYFMWKALLGSILLSEPKILFNGLSFIYSKFKAEGIFSSIIQGIKVTGQGWIHNCVLPNSSKCKLQRKGSGTQTINGESSWKIFNIGRGCSSFKSHKERQSNRESSDNVQCGAYKSTSQRYKETEAKEILVYNLDVHQDNTYVAGGYVVHNCHYNCRSHLIPLADTEENRRMLKDPSRDPAKRKVEPLPRGWKS